MHINVTTLYFLNLIGHRQIFGKQRKLNATNKLNQNPQRSLTSPSKRSHTPFWGPFRDMHELPMLQQVNSQTPGKEHALRNGSLTATNLANMILAKCSFQIRT